MAISQVSSSHGMTSVPPLIGHRVHRHRSPTHLPLHRPRTRDASRHHPRHRRINRLTRRVVLFALLLARFLWDANDAREVAVPGGRTQRPVGSGRRTIHLATPSAHGPEGADLGTAG